MNPDLDPPLVPPTAAELAKQAKLWAWYVRGHFCLTLLWALMSLEVIPQPAEPLLHRIVNRIVNFSALEILAGPILSIVLISRAARYGGVFVKLAIAESFLSASGFWIMLPAFQ